MTGWENKNKVLKAVKEDGLYFNMLQKRLEMIEN